MPSPLYPTERPMVYYNAGEDYELVVVRAPRTPQMRVAERVIAYVTSHPLRANIHAWRSVDYARAYLRQECAADANAGALRKVHVINNHAKWWYGMNWSEISARVLECIGQQAVESAYLKEQLRLSRYVCQQWLTRLMGDGLLGRHLTHEFPTRRLYYRINKDA
jgi:hypothetical protein